MITVRIPATSANMGAGFDCMGVAVNLYNTIEISEIKSGLEIVGSNVAEFIPRNGRNLVYRSMLALFDEVGYKACGIRIRQKSDIPVTRGLGSSSACVVGGMIAANILSGKKLSYPEILNLAFKVEGHTDNITPAMFGGMCISAVDGEKIIHKSIKIDPGIKFAVIIPDYFIGTRKSRKTLPDKLPYADAVFNISRAAGFALCMAEGKLDGLREFVRDRMHQPYRKDNISGFDKISEKSYELGSKATYLSGSGPSMICIINENYSVFADNMNKFMKENDIAAVCRVLSVDNVGAVVKY
ncbi:MAG: homoserine kinase [Oscillospiraceae bacterium]|nr:homoserine kinase [Oscillospiraceae bacterium]